ncbi:hypothetical protein U5A82_02800 [Sphingobium sp. CR2-8]|uniref:hypothetical protein n=1 Tax=Sphingobium sp. CR2-8 TaxID=1306534 RepID=UPI002DBB35B5|nr:hypothetical protein [Sphingobium sp. CR2-8]MEC3909438.1 hypothetical protein [Sphingobium sp. CR2-8]
MVYAMYRILPKQWIFGASAWLVLALMFLFGTVNEFREGTARLGAIPNLAWWIVLGVLYDPIWRYAWKKISWLRNWFPDLNGDWDVEIRSNWSRQLQLLDAAASTTVGFDTRGTGSAHLVPLDTVKLKARIKQGWWKIEMQMWNPAGDTPIKDSDTLLVDPFPANGLRRPGIAYFFKQRNQTDEWSDASEFDGAAKVEYDEETGQLSGLFWTNRVWQRAMNTAGTITFTRVVT